MGPWPRVSWYRRRMSMRDVHPLMLKKHDEMLRAQTLQERVTGVERMWTTGRQMAWLNVRSRHPSASDALVQWLVAELVYGSAAAERVLGLRPAT